MSEPGSTFSRRPTSAPPPKASWQLLLPVGVLVAIAVVVVALLRFR